MKNTKKIFFKKNVSTLNEKKKNIEPCKMSSKQNTRGQQRGPSKLGKDEKSADRVNESNHRKQ